MEASSLSFEKVSYAQRLVSSFIYVPVWNEDGSIKDFRIVDANDTFAKDWLEIYHNSDFIGACLREGRLLDDYSLGLLESFMTEKPRPFVSYLPLVDMHLYFEPVAGLKEPYAGFYVTNLTNYSSQDAREHFIRNIKQMKNNAVLMQRYENGEMKPIFVSEEFARMMECSVEEARELMTGINFYKTTVADDRPLIRSMMERRVAYDGSSGITIQKITAKHNVIWCTAHYSFIDDYDEHYVYCTYNDVTALKRHEERLRSTYSRMGDNFYHVNNRTLANLRVNLTKNIFEEVKGADLYDTDSLDYSYSDALRMRALSFPILSERTQFLKIFDKEKLKESYLAGQTNVSQIVFSIRKSGKSCFVRFSTAITRHPLTNDIVAFITEQECNSEKVKDTLTDKILAQQFDMVAYLVDGKYGVTIGDPGRIKYGSIFPTSNFGDYQTYLDKQVTPVLSGDEEHKEESRRALQLETVKEQLAIEDPYVVNIAIDMDGETYYKQFDFYSVDPDANFYILLKTDTTKIQKEHMALNEQLKLALDAANQANIAKTAFLSSMSHEIRTPMNAIIGLDSIALREPNLSQKTKDQLEKIGGSARHLLSLINDILDMSRIESGRLTIKNEEFSFSEMLEQINTMINSQCQDKGLTFECEINGAVDDYYIGDDMKLKQVIINILGNAVKFTPAPGKVSFIVERTAQFEGQSTLRFVMKDTGIGMDKAFLPRIFEAFSQENESKANKYGSTGLGMAITKNIVELMNGNISVDSEKGVGSTFTVNVTLRNSERKAQRTENELRPQDMKVLVIDDDPIACEHAKAVLEEIGISADIAESGKEALDMIQLKSARREAYNLIFVDWSMPDQDGVEVTREIRRLIGSESAVVVLTAYSWDDIEEDAVDAGVDSFLSKPLFASNVFSAFHRAMEHKHQMEEKEQAAELAGRRVLIAEDMEINAEILIDILDIEEITAEHAQNGQIAVDMFAASEAGYYDAILMDVRMPVLNGLGAAEAIRALDRPDAKTIPIIAMTANAFDEDVQRSLQAGMNAHLSKPVEPDRLFAALGALIKD